MSTRTVIPAKPESRCPCAGGKGIGIPAFAGMTQGRALPSPPMPYRPDMDVSDLRVAIFSGNYNYVRDGANQALNRLADYLLRQGAAVRVYSPTTRTPAFAPKGDLVSHARRCRSRAAPNIRSASAIPPRRAGATSGASSPTSSTSPAPTSPATARSRLARRWDLPVIASVHTRFETYPRYYGMAFLEPVLLAVLRRFYRRCDAIFAPSDSMAQLLRDQRMNYDVGIWTRGIDREIFNPGRRDLAWRRALGIADDDAGGRLRRPAGDGKGPRRLFRHDRPAGAARRSGTRCWSSATGRRATGSRSGCPTRSSPASRPAPISAARSPRWTCCSTRR